MKYKIKEKNKSIVEYNLKLLKEYRETSDEKIKKQIREQIFFQNQNLIYSILSKYNLKESQIDEFKQIGYIAILNAIENFDPSKGENFATYATYCIKHDFDMSPDLYRSDLYYPEYMRQKINYYRILQNQGKTDEEIKKILGFSDSVLNQCKKAYIESLSLDSSPRFINNLDDSLSYHELISDDSEHFSLKVEQVLLNKRLKEIFSALTLEEQKIIYYRYLITKKKTLCEVAAILGCSRETVCKKQQTAKRKIKKQLVDF